MNILYIKQQETYEWLLHKHYAKRIPSITDAFGLYDDGVLVGICTFGIPASRNLCIGVCGEKFAKNVFELNRLCIDDSARQKKPNVASYFVGACLRRMNRPDPTIIVSYADTAMNHVGIVYQATNFLFTGTTKERTDISTEDGKHSRHYEKKEDYSENRKIRSAKHRYVYFLGNRKQKKELRNALKYDVLPYEDGKSERYDASYKPSTQMSFI